MSSSPSSPTPDFPTGASASTQQGSLRSLRRHRAAIDIAAIAASPLAVSPKRSNDRPSTAPLSPDPSKTKALKGAADGVRMRKRSSQSLRERSKPPSGDDPAPSPGMSRRVKGSAPTTGAPSTVPSTEPSPPRTPEPRLGHPSRPYYTAIRKNMSQSTSPRIPSPSSSPPPPTSYLSTRPSTDYAARASTDYLGRASGSAERSSLPMRRVGGGSVSGEVELHMALAQRRSEDAPHARQEYVFTETRLPPAEPTPRPSRLRRFSQSLRSMFFGRR